MEKQSKTLYVLVRRACAGHPILLLVMQKHVYNDASEKGRVTQEWIQRQGPREISSNNQWGCIGHQCFRKAAAPFRCSPDDTVLSAPETE